MRPPVYDAPMRRPPSRRADEYRALLGTTVPPACLGDALAFGLVVSNERGEWVATERGR